MASSARVSRPSVSCDYGLIDVRISNGKWNMMYFMCTYKKSPTWDRKLNLLPEIHERFYDLPGCTVKLNWLNCNSATRKVQSFLTIIGWSYIDDTDGFLFTENSKCRKYSSSWLRMWSTYIIAYHLMLIWVHLKMLLNVRN